MNCLSITAAFFLLLTIPSVLAKVRQAPFCVNSSDQLNLKRFEPIFQYYNTNPQKFVPVSPDTFRSPTGFIQNITLTRITINSPLLSKDHVWRTLYNFFHITINAAAESDGMEGLYIQAIGAPLGVPVGEFVTDFDCGDCSQPSSSLNDITFKIPCSHPPAAAYIHPTILSIGGDEGKPVRKFHEAHFNFRYVDYPCFDVIYAQFLIIVVRQFAAPMTYEVFFSSMYKVNIEGIGSPYPMYYGWTPEEIECHHATDSYMNNWNPQKSQRTKVKFNEHYENCMLMGTGKLEGTENICPPGPITCGVDYDDYVASKGRKSPPETISQWVNFRKAYVMQNDAERGTEVYCKDCGQWENHIGTKTWPDPPVVVEEQEIELEEIPIIGANKTIIYKYVLDCEKRDLNGKDPTGNRNRSGDSANCEKNFDKRLVNLGYRTGLKILKIHGLLMIFVWTMGLNSIIYCGRFLKELSVVEKGSGCFGIGNWMWHHFFWIYISMGVVWAGAGIFGLCTAHQINATCNSYDSSVDTEACKDMGTIHKNVGGLALMFFIMSFVSGWDRPVGMTFLRNMLILYHIACGYLAKYIGLITLITIPGSALPKVVVILLVMMEVTFWIFFILATVMQIMADKEMLLRVQGRKYFPTVEGVNTFIESPFKKTRAMIFPAMILVQFGLFMGISFSYFG